jgi:hypothetical protein
MAISEQRNVYVSYAGRFFQSESMTQIGIRIISYSLSRWSAALRHPVLGMLEPLIAIIAIDT